MAPSNITRPGTGADPARLGVHPLAEALRDLYRAFNNMSMYPDGHPSVPRAIERATASFHAALAGRPSLIVRVAAEQLLLDDESLTETSGTLRSLAQLLHDLDVAALEFRQGLDQGQLESLVRHLSEARADAIKGAQLSHVVGGHLEHVRVCPIDYQALTFADGVRSPDEHAAEGDVWESLSRVLTDPAYFAGGGSVQRTAADVEAELARQEGTGVGELRASLNQQMMQMESRPADQREAIRERMGMFLGALNPDLRRDLLHVGANRPREAMELMVAFADRLPTRELVEALTNADRAAAQTPDELVFLLSKLVRVAREQPAMSCEIEQTLERWGVAPSVLRRNDDDLKAAMEEVFHYRTGHSFNPDDYRGTLGALARRELHGFVRESATVYRDPTDPDDLRMHAAEIGVLLLGNPDGDELRPALFGHVATRIDLLLQHRHYASLSGAARAARAIRAARASRADAEPDCEDPIDRAAAGFLSEFAERGRIERILDGICVSSMSSSEAVELLELGGVTAVDRAVDRLEDDLTPSAAAALHEFLLSRPADCWEQVIALQFGRDWEDVRSRLELLQWLPADAAVPLLETLLRHESSRVRRESLRVLCRVAPQGRERYLGRALVDASETMVAEGLRGLAEIASPAAIELLGRCAEGRLSDGAAGVRAKRLAVQLLVEAGDPGSSRLCAALRTLARSPRPDHARQARWIAEALRSADDKPEVRRALKSWSYSVGWLVSRLPGVRA